MLLIVIILIIKCRSSGRCSVCTTPKSSSPTSVRTVPTPLTQRTASCPCVPPASEPIINTTITTASEPPTSTSSTLSLKSRPFPGYESKLHSPKLLQDQDPLQTMDVWDKEAQGINESPQKMLAFDEKTYLEASFTCTLPPNIKTIW